MRKEESNKLCSESVNRAIASIENGIVIVYHDHLSCDSFRVYVRKDGETLKPEKKFRYRWSDEKKDYEILEEEFARWDYSCGDCREVNMMTSSSYYGSVGLADTVKILSEKYGLPVYYLNLGWCTFPSAWCDTSGYIDCIRKYTPVEVNRVTCDFTPCKLNEFEE